jgi:glycine betaine/choline ABC-type transport system substrate-binding protein
MKTYEEFKRRFEEEMTSTASVPGAGDDNQTVIVRKKYDRKNKRKSASDMLRRYFPEKFKK